MTGWVSSVQPHFSKITQAELHELQKRDIFIHPDSQIGKFTTIGDGTNINGPAFIASSQKGYVTIGKYCAIAYNLRVRPRNHYTGYINLQDKLQNRYNFPRLELIKGPVKIGNNVWIGDNVTILSGASIGDGSIVGAGSIVTKDVPQYSIAAGNPIKIIKKRFSENIIYQLKSIHWWDWPEDKIIRNRLFFETDFSICPDINLCKIMVD